MTVSGVVGACVILPEPIGPTVMQVDTREKTVALTFDDGPNPLATPALLDVLAEAEVTATFFLVGTYVEAYPDLARRIDAAGHEIGNHSWDRRVLAFQNAANRRKAIRDTDAALAGIDIEKPCLVRAPKLMIGKGLARELTTDGRVVAGGLVSGWDWWTQNPDIIAREVLRGVRPGSIIVLHDGDDQKDKGERMGSVLAAKQIIEALQADGYRIVPLGQLLREAGRSEPCLTP